MTLGVETLEPRLLLAASGPRQMEYLGRGVVATRSSSTGVFVSWRSMAQDVGGMGFNVYRSANGGAAVKLNASLLTGGTNFSDNAANLALANSYFVKPVVGGVEQAASASYTLKANTAIQPLFSIPLRDIGSYDIRHISVGDLDGDGEYDFVVGRRPMQSDSSERIEAYRRDGTFLWSVDCGPNSLDLDNIEPGSSAIDVGNWDGVTVYDMDNDGKAEVLYRSANGVVFGDGTTLTNSNDNIQYISVLNGMTGAERARVQLPTDYLSDGPLAASLGVGYLDGVHPSLVAKLKNRIGAGDFHQLFVAYDFNGTAITQKWKYASAPVDSDNGHQIRIVDVDQDGDDEIADTAQVINGDGTLKYNMRPAVVHGDRFHIGDLDPDRPGLEGYGIQQNNPSFLAEYYYDAATGELLHQHFDDHIVDNGRGVVADVDPDHRGYEYWSFYGIYNSTTPTSGAAPVETKLADEPNRPWPNFRVWWDGDVLSENLNDTVIDKWNPATQGSSRVTTLYHYGSPSSTSGEAPVFYGDIIGDWREEVVFERSDHTALNIYTTQIASSTRLYTLAQNPEYRNGLTVKGYLQSNMVDYYLGSGMATPPPPNIVMHPPTAVIAPPASPSGLTASIGARGVQVNLNWSAVAGAASYNVRRGLANGGPWAVIGNTTATSFTDSGIAPNGGSYYYVITQITPAGGGGGAESTPSNQAHVTIGQPPTSNTYQAEAGAVSGGTVIASNASGYAGTGFADFPSNGGVLEWTNLDGGGGGTGVFTFKYALASGTRTGTLTINGVARSITFTSTGAWNNWETLTVTATVTPGATNTVRLQSTGQNLANIDQVRVDVAAPPFMYSGTASADRYDVHRNGANIDVWVNGDGAGPPTYSLIYSMTPSLTFTASGGDDSLTLDESSGNPTPAYGVSFDGGGGAGDSLTIIAATGADTASFAAGSVRINGSVTTHSGTEAITFDGNGGWDNVTVSGGPAVTLADGQKFQSLVLSSDARAAFTAGGSASAARSVDVMETAQLDLSDTTLIIDTTDPTAIGTWNGSAYTGYLGRVAAGYNFGGWDGHGIVTTRPQALAGLTTIAIATGEQLLGLGASDTANFAGQTVTGRSVILKYTYAGDANLDGVIDGGDYGIIDNFAQLPAANSYFNGDFNFDGVIDGGDYGIIDNNIQAQGPSL